MEIWWVTHCCQHISCYFVSCSFLGNRRENSFAFFKIMDGRNELCQPQMFVMLYSFSAILTITDEVLTQPVVQQLLSTARSLADHYHQSNPAFQTFSKIQSQLDLPEHLLIQDFSTQLSHLLTLNVNHLLNYIPNCGIGLKRLSNYQKCLKRQPVKWVENMPVCQWSSH